VCLHIVIVIVTLPSHCHWGGEGKSPWQTRQTSHGSIAQLTPRVVKVRFRLLLLTIGDVTARECWRRCHIRQRGRSKLIVGNIIILSSVDCARPCVDMLIDDMGISRPEFSQGCICRERGCGVSCSPQPSPIMHDVLLVVSTGSICYHVSLRPCFRNHGPHATTF